MSAQQHRLIKRVVKVGGSLLGDAQLQSRIKRWQEQHIIDDSATVWVVGGGALVDCLRNFQSIHQTPNRVLDSQFHWLAIDLMSITARSFGQLFPSWPIVSTISSIHNRVHIGNANTIFDSSAWLRKTNDLPEDWTVTSDSIAARLAIELTCAEVILLKSTQSAGQSVQENVQAGVVDQHLGHLADQIPVKIIKL